MMNAQIVQHVKTMFVRSQNVVLIQTVWILSTVKQTILVMMDAGQIQIVPCLVMLVKTMLALTQSAVLI